jgi:CDP-6-deoxy-D-xylo-4-hexulose-3-dehydrase
MAVHSERISVMQVADGGECSWFAIPLTIDADAGFTRDELADFLESKGIETRPIVAGNLAEHPAAKGFPMLSFGKLPGAQAIHERGMYLGLHPVDSAQSLNRVCDLIDEFVGLY